MGLQVSRSVYPEAAQNPDARFRAAAAKIPSHEGRPWTFDAIAVGDRPAPLSLLESVEMMLRKNDLRLAGGI